jgi:hypothetical protein
VILLISDAAQANDYKTKIGPPRTPHPKPCAAPAVPAGAAPAASRRGAAYLLAGRGGVQSRFSRRARRSASPTASSSATWSAPAAAAPRAPRLRRRARPVITHIAAESARVETPKLNNPTLRPPAPRRARAAPARAIC